MEFDRIGPYIIDHKIGSGGMGTVYLAQHAETGEDVAVKILPPALAREEGFVARFEREIESLQTLINPQIVKLLDSGTDHNTYYYAMEYVEGETLTDRLRREKRIPWREVVEYSLQICSALKSAHNAGIIHRDLKPSNLLLDKSNNIKLTDFGVAQVFAAGRLTMQGGIIGTAEYMSPEQAHGRRATKKSDLYSLGAVMYTMLAGRPPFVEKTTLEVIHKHKYGTFDRPSRYADGIPRRLEEAVCQLLEKDPDKRFPDALVLSRRLEEILRRADIASQEETRVAETKTPGNGPGEVLVENESGIPEGEIGGTLVRDLVRADIEGSQESGLFSRLFDNTWVLLGLFVLLVAGGVVWFKTVGQHSSLEGDVQRVSAKLRNARIKLESALNSHPPDRTTVFVRRAIQALENGDARQAERLLTSVQFLADSQNGGEAEQSYFHDLNEVLEDVRKIDANPPDGEIRNKTANELLEQAQTLLHQDGESEKARMIWQSIIDVYENDPACAEEVKIARDNLDGTASDSAAVPIRRLPRENPDAPANDDDPI